MPLDSNLEGLTLRAFPDPTEICIPKQGAMADHARAGNILGIARDLFSFHHNIISPGKFSCHSHIVQNIDHWLGEFAKIMEIIRRVGSNERKVEVAKVMIDSPPTTGKAPNNDDIVLLHIVNIDLLNSNLVASDNN